MISFKTALAMVGQTKITICLVGIVVILAIFTNQANANVKKLKKDVKKLQKKDKEIISQLEDLDYNYDAVTQIVDHIITEGEMVKTLIGELEKKDQELNLTMQDIQDKGGLLSKLYSDFNLYIINEMNNHQHGRLNLSAT